MIATHRMSAQAHAASVRYGLVIEGWRAIYSTSLDRADFGAPAQIAKAIATAYEIGHRYLATERTLIGDAFRETHKRASDATVAELRVDDARDDESASAAIIDAQESFLAREIATQIERDIAFLEKSLRSTAIHVGFAARAQGVDARTALIQHRARNGAELSFFFHDRRNQRWATPKFIRAVWRLTLLNLYNETVLHVLTDHGQHQAQVWHVDPTSAVHGRKVSVLAGAEAPAYSNIRGEIFHPNADAILTAVR